MIKHIHLPPRPVFVATTLVALCLMGWCFPVHAQTITPSQLQQLENLTPAQKRQLINALGGTIPGSSSDEQRETNDSAMEITVPELDEPEPQSDRIEIAALDFLIVDLSVDESFDGRLLDSVSRALGRNVYQIDSQGFLDFPGAGAIMLSGLTDEEAQLRLTAEPALRDVFVHVSRLPVTASGSASLEPFGHDLFKSSAGSFTPASDLPVPVNYTLGVGDELSLLIYGQYNASYNLRIDRNGAIVVPEIGPVQVSGMALSDARAELAERVTSRYIGVDVSLKLGELRSIQVFVLGDVTNPGSYTVSSLATITNALFISGGISTNGSLRGVQLKRRNKVVGVLDLYELLLKGNTRQDLRLRQGDAIFVPPVAEQVSVFGRVKRPAIYELAGESTVNEVIALAGGLLPDAFTRQIRIEKYDDAGKKSIVVSDIQNGSTVRVGAGDQLEVLRALDQVTDAVTLHGHIDRNVKVQWRYGMRLLDLIPDAELFQLQADQSYILIRRKNEQTGEIRLLSANWQLARNNPLSEQNKPLDKGDAVYVFSLDTDRAERIAPLVNEIRRQAGNEESVQTVFVQGGVRSGGEFPYESGMRVSDLLRAAGGIRDHAFQESAELTRTTEINGRFDTRHIALSLRDLDSVPAEDLQLVPGDVMTVKEMPLWRERQRVEIVGEIEFPGTYSVSRGERLSTVVARAGGLTDMAFAGGSVFLRDDLREREQKQIERLASRVRAEINAIGGGDRAEARSRAEALLQQLEGSEALGRLVIDLSLAMLGDPQHDVILEDGDRLVIPGISQEVTVIGEVQYPTSHIYDKQLDQSAYIYKSGGVTRNADVKRIYVIRADGQVVAQQASNWFRRSGASIETRPGDTIVVPLDSDRISNLSLWTSVTQIVYNIGVAAAAVASF
ncbi:MAG: SLBB domain-containing protein [Pseudomonadota bacterium]